MPTNTREIGFEEFIENYLVHTNGYISRTSASYDKGNCLDSELFLRFVKETQPEQWEKLIDQYADEAGEKLLKRLDDELRNRGVLEVVRKGIEHRGLHIDCAYVKPASTLNEETLRLYEANIFSVTRQLRYSEQNENSIDMVLFLNGIPFTTIELKNQLTGQSVKNGMRQYQMDRDPKESLLSFKRCLVHFTIDTEVVFMTTQLKGLKTRFLPFNKGNRNSAGNPEVEGKYKTHYMWEDLFTRDSVMELIGRFLCIQTEEMADERGRSIKKETLIFPRYHQRDTVKRLEADVLANTKNQNYLIQHSAGSGKSNTIAWVAHRLADLHRDSDEAVFDTVVIVTDRRVLDRQLRDTVLQFEQVAGVVKPITENSEELRKALEQGERVIVTTLQKFPVIVKEVGALPGQRFAVIIDEAHSSQSGESSKHLKQVLQSDSLDDAAEQDDTKHVDTVEDMLNKEMRSRSAKKGNISFFAFTATPKQKTLELFGMQNPADGKFYPFSLYSMKQAIDEGFILDVLKNYTTYQTYFELRKQAEEDPAFEKGKAKRVLLHYVERHEHAIEKKVEIIVEHFVHQIANQINGHAKAMLVTKSRLHAVRYKLAFDAYLKKHGYRYGALAAFSGKVRDGEIDYTEASMNGFSENQTANQFKNEENKFLIVAEKFQTGFDQPLLTVMYVDKKLGGVNAVQTLSRLNRTYPGKKEVFVLDFVNDSELIKDAFQPYYTTTVLSEETDPDILHDLHRDVLNYGLFDETEIDQLCAAYFGGKDPGVLNGILDGYVQRFSERLVDEQEDFRSKAKEYIRKYAFISQIITYEETRLEKLYIFLRFLVKKLPFTPERLPVEVLDSIDMESYKIVKKGDVKIELEDEAGIIEPMSSSSRSMQEEEKELLSKIIRDVNDKFGTAFTDDDRVVMKDMATRLVENETLKATLQNNTRDAAKIKYDQMFQEELVSMLNRHFDFYKKLDSNKEIKDLVNSRMFDYVHKKLQDSPTAKD